MSTPPSWTSARPGDVHVVGLLRERARAALVSAENTLFEEAAAQGQSVFAASGDSGSTDCGTPPQR